MNDRIGIDLGTSGVKTVRFHANGNAVRMATADYPMAQPQNGWAEQDPADWWHAVQQTLDEVGTDGVACIGLSGQMHGLVMLDAQGEVIRPAILWCDQRTGAQCEEITARVGRAQLIEWTANPALPGFTLPKLLWVREYEPQNYARCRHILLPKDYIRYKLTGVLATDVSDASGTQLLDVRNRCWSGKMLDTMAINSALLPPLYESTAIVGYYRGIPVAAGGGDNACAAVGCGAVRPGKAFTTIGTSGVVYAHTDRPVIDPQGRVHTFCCAVPGQWHVMGVTQAAGLSLKWFRHTFAPETSYAQMDRMAAQVPIGAERLLWLPYLMGERTPHLDGAARGVFFGVSAIHEQPHFVRSVMEGVCYSLQDCAEVLRSMNVPLTDMAACGGGSVSSLWMQMLAGCLHLPVTTLKTQEGAARGAAILAAVGAGLESSVEAACDRQIVPGRTIAPEHSADYDRFYEIYRSLYPALKPSFAALARLGSEI